MSLARSDPRLEALLARLGDYARELVLRSGVHAARLHADAVTPDHLLSTLMDDADSAAAATVLHAFADPETISGEALALSPGVMVVASDSTLPFSPGALAALYAARARAERRGASEVEIEDLLDEALLALAPDLGARLAAAGIRAAPARTSASAASAGDAAPPPADEPLFRRFSAGAKRALSAANRAAAAYDLAEISPAHLVLGCLKSDEALATRAGIGFTRARMLFGDRTADDAPPDARELPADPALLAFLDDLPAGAGSVDLLLRFHAGGTPELAQILTRHKLAASLLLRARAAFRDPSV